MYKCGLVPLTDLRDSYVENPLENFEVMQLVRYVVTFLRQCILYFLGRAVKNVDVHEVNVSTQQCEGFFP